MGAAVKAADAEKQPAGTWGAAAEAAGTEEWPAGTKGTARAEETAETNDEGPGTAKRTEEEVVEAAGPKRGAEEGTGDERRGAEDAKRPTEVGARKKAAASENGRTGARIEDPADETANGEDPATTGGTSEASGEPGKPARGAKADGETTELEAGEGGFWQNQLHLVKR